MGSCVIWGENVSKYFGNTIVFKKADWCFDKGFSLLWAPNGMGKSTLLKMSLSLLKPTSGKTGISVDKSRIGLMLDYQDIPLNVKVERFVSYAASLRGVKVDNKYLFHLMEELSLSKKLSKKENLARG